MLSSFSRQPAVLPDRRLLAEPEVQRRRLELAIRVLRGRDDRLLHPAAEELVALVAVNGHGARRVMRVRAVDENVATSGMLSALATSSTAGSSQVASQHEHVARDDGDFTFPAARRLLDHDRDRPQLALLALHLVRHDAAADDHVVIGFEFDRRRRRRWTRWTAHAQNQDQTHENREPSDQQSPACCTWNGRREVRIVPRAESGRNRLPTAPAFGPGLRLVFWWLAEGADSPANVDSAGAVNGVRTTFPTSSGVPMSWSGWFRWLKNQIHMIGCEPPPPRRPAPAMQRSLHRLEALLEQGSGRDEYRQRPSSRRTTRPAARRSSNPAWAAAALATHFAPSRRASPHNSSSLHWTLPIGRFATILVQPTLTSTDAAAARPGDYTFTAEDFGGHRFSVTISTNGSQSVSVTEAAAPANTGSATQGIADSRGAPLADTDPSRRGNHGKATPTTEPGIVRGAGPAVGELPS